MKLSDIQIQEITQKYLKEYIDDIKQEIIGYFGTLDYRTFESIVDDLLKENGIEDIDKSSVSYQKLCRGILRAQLKGIDIEKKQMHGEYSDDVSSMKHHELELQSTKQESTTLSQATKDYWDESSYN